MDTLCQSMLTFLIVKKCVINRGHLQQHLKFRNSVEELRIVIKIHEDSDEDFFRLWKTENTKFELDWKLEFDQLFWAEISSLLVSTEGKILRKKTSSSNLG